MPFGRSKQLEGPSGAGVSRACAFGYSRTGLAIGKGGFNGIRGAPVQSVGGRVIHKAEEDIAAFA
jgi:hypothetical protein